MSNARLTATCICPNALEAAAESDGRFPVRLSNGSVVSFYLTGDDLEARVTPEQAQILAGFSIYRVEGFDPVVDPVAPVEDWDAEGHRLHKVGKGQIVDAARSNPGEVVGMLAAAIPGFSELVIKAVADRVGTHAQDAADARAQAIVAEPELDPVNHKSVARNYTRDQALRLLNEHDPAYDGTQAHENVLFFRLAKLAQDNPELHRELLAGMVV